MFNKTFDNTIFITQLEKIFVVYSLILQTSTQDWLFEMLNNSSQVNSIAELLLPHAGNTVSNLCIEMSQ